MAEMLFTCPACGAEMVQHLPATDETYEAWRFMCSAEVVKYENGTLDENDPCRDALPNALKKLNQIRKVPA